MNSPRLKQIVLSFCVVLSLFASSFAACGCSHHQEKVETGASSCHQNSTENHSDEMPMPAGDSTTFERTDDCVCVQAAPRVFAKSEIVKIAKQTAAAALRVSIAFESNAPVATVEDSRSIKPFYLSDSFDNLKSPRAPPVL